jgi:hypothetical protein
MAVATHAPQQRCKPEHQLALHVCSSVVIFVTSRATTTVSAVNPCPLRATTKSGRLVLARDEHVGPRNAKPRLVASARHHLQFSRSSIQLTAQSTRGNNGPKPSKRTFVVGRLRRFSHAIAIIAAAITSAATVDSPEISPHDQDCQGQNWNSLTER